MSVLTIASQKGGVGKTTVSLNLACSLARRKWRVLLIDLDPQGAIGLSLGRSRKSLKGVAEFLREGGPLSDYVLRTRLGGLSLMAVGHVAIQDTHSFATYLQDNRVPERLNELAAQDYDIVMFDTPAGFGGATLAALDASDFIVGVLQAEPIAMRSAPQMMEMVASMRRKGMTARMLGFVLTMFQADDPASMGVAESAFSELPRGAVFRTLIHRDPAILAASASMVPVSLMGQHAPPVAASFDQLAAEVEQRAGLTRETDDEGEVPFIV